MTEQEYIDIGNLIKIRAAKSLIQDISFSGGEENGAVQQHAKEQTVILGLLVEWEDDARLGLKITRNPKP